jgi:DNA-directed RNA polymerase subunit RPC12/RpoP
MKKEKQKIYGKIKCNHCNVLFTIEVSDIKKKKFIEENLNLSKSYKDFDIKTKWYDPLNYKCISGYHYDLNQKQKMFVNCPFCKEEILLRSKIIKTISSRRKEIVS